MHVSLGRNDPFRQAVEIGRLRPNQVWAMDFVHDQLATGKKIRVLTVVDTFSRYVPVLDARFSYRGEDVVATLDRVCRKAGYPATIRVDQGTDAGFANSRTRISVIPGHAFR